MEVVTAKHPNASRLIDHLSDAVGAWNDAVSLTRQSTDATKYTYLISLLFLLGFQIDLLTKERKNCSCEVLRILGPDAIFQ